MSSYTNTVFSANFGLEPPATMARRLVRCNISQCATLPINSMSVDHINIHISSSPPPSPPYHHHHHHHHQQQQQNCSNKNNNNNSALGHSGLFLRILQQSWFLLINHTHQHQHQHHYHHHHHHMNCVALHCYSLFAQPCFSHHHFYSSKSHNSPPFITEHHLS